MKTTIGHFKICNKDQSTVREQNTSLRLCLLNADRVINILIKINKPTAVQCSTITALGYQINGQL